MKKENNDAWNEFDEEIFRMLGVDDISKTVQNDDTDSFDYVLSLCFTLEHFQQPLREIEKHLILFPASC